MGSTSAAALFSSLINFFVAYSLMQCHRENNSLNNIVYWFSQLWTEVQDIRRIKERAITVVVGFCKYFFVPFDPFWPYVNVKLQNAL